MLDFALILQIIIFILNKFYNFKLLLEIWKNLIIPLLIIHEKYEQNASNLPNTQANVLKENTERISDERSDLRNDRELENNHEKNN